MFLTLRAVAADADELVAVVKEDSGPAPWRLGAVGVTGG